MNLNNAKNEYEFLLENGTNGLVYELNEDSKSYSVTGYKGTEKKVFIPEKFENLPITKIEASAFENCDFLTDLFIDKNIKSINKYAFFNCKLLEKVYYNGTIIDWCSIKFSNEYSNPMHYGIHFYMHDINNDYKEITDINLSNIEIIGNYQFCGFENIKKIEIDNSAIIIGEYAFYNCTSLESIKLSKNIKSINLMAFLNCTSLDKVFYDGSIDNWCNISFGCHNSNPFVYANYIYIKDESCEYKKLEEIIIPNTIKEIGNYQFIGFNNVKISIPSSVESISDCAFDNCKLNSIYVDSDNPNYKSINGSLYSKDEKRLIKCCEKGTTFTVSKSIKEINSYAFYDFSLLDKVYYEGTLTDWCNIKFGNEYSNPMYYANHFYMKDSDNKYQKITKICNFDNVKKIGNYQFCGFKITDLIITDSVESIGEGAFYNCEFLKEVEIGNNVISIGCYSFMNCTSLKKINLSDRLVNIGFKAFANCNLLESVIIPNVVKSIGFEAFSDCKSLKKVFIPKSVSDIGFDMFLNCKQLTIYFEDAIKKKEWNLEEMFDGIPLVFECKI